MSDRLAKKLLIVGWDAADWKIIDRLLALKRMPALQSLLDRGCRGDLASLDPKLSPLLWTSIATGKTADKHGVLNFVEVDAERQALRIASSASRKTKALWNILTQNAMTTHVVGWYASHPAEPIRGVCVSNQWLDGFESGGPVPEGAAHPADWAEDLADMRLSPTELVGEELSPMLPKIRDMDGRDKRIHLLAKLMAQCASTHNAATLVLSEETAWDCAMVFYDTIDVVGHHFMQYYPPRMAHVSEKDFDLYQYVMTGVYQMHDMMLARLLDIAGPETTVILLSDHGFHSDHLRPRVPPAIDDEHAAMDASWHRQHGVLVMAGPGIKTGETIYGATLLDITPSALTLLGLPVGSDMDGRVLREVMEGGENREIDRVFSWDDLEGESGMLPADRRQDPLAAAEALKQLVELGYLADTQGDTKAQLDLVNRETRFNLGVVHMTRGRIREAVEIFGALSAERFEDSRYTMNFARCLHALQRNAEAAETIRRFLEVAPGHADARILMGSALFVEGKLEEAGAALEQAEREAPDRMDLACLLAEAYLQLNRLDDAERQVGRAVEANPHDARAHHARARLALQREQFEECVDACLTAVGLQHFFPDAHHTLGVALTWMKDYPHAIQSFKVALSMSPGMVDAHRFLASIYRLQGDRQNAPRHRDAATDLLDTMRRGEMKGTALPAEAPMGPQEWAKRAGVDADA